MLIVSTAHDPLCRFVAYKALEEVAEYKLAKQASFCVAKPFCVARYAHTNQFSLACLDGPLMLLQAGDWRGLAQAATAGHWQSYSSSSRQLLHFITAGKHNAAKSLDVTRFL